MTGQPQKLDLRAIEDVSADLSVAQVFVTATESFVCETRRWIAISPGLSGGSAIKSLIDLDTMLLELRDKIDLAKDKIDNFVDQACAARRAAKAD